MNRFVAGTTITAAVGVNTLVLLLPLVALSRAETLRDARTWLLVTLAGALITCEALAAGNRLHPGRSALPEPDRAARRLAMWSSLVLLLIFVCSLLAADSTQAIPLQALLAALGTIMFITGIALRTAAIHALGPMFRSEVSIPAGQTLVQDGIYRCLRHPSEAGLLLVALGAAIVTLSLPAIVLVAGVILPLTRVRIALEERCLAESFGAKFHTYRHTTGALIPWPLRRAAA